MATEITTHDPKAMARRLRAALAEHGIEIGHSRALELVARACGARDWNTFVSRREAGGVSPQPAVPLLRMIDWTATRRHYVELLDATVNTISDDGDHTPRYVTLTLPGGARLHLSEHHGDGTPGASVLVAVADLDAHLASLTSTGHGTPLAIADTDRGRSITVHDPAGNRLVFVPADEAGRRVVADVPPIVHHVDLPMSPIEAFELVTSFSWWHDYGLADGGHASIDDGAVVFHNPDGDLTIGRVLTWEPGVRYAQTFTLAQDPDVPTTLTATFQATTEGTRVRFEHGGWTASNSSRRGHFSDWPLILAGLTDA